MVWKATGAITFTGIFEKMAVLHSEPDLSHRRRALHLLRAPSARSAQFPLHVWLPDAMEGPTPVSALIHAATMVAAGVYMLARVFFLISGSATALDGHRMDRHHHRGARGAHGDAAGRHQAHPRLLHAFAARLHGQRGRPRLHRRRRCFTSSRTLSSRRCSSSAPARSSTRCIMSRTSGAWAAFASDARTFLTFAIGTLALMGCFPFAGFFSKDAILLAAWQQTIVGSSCSGFSPPFSPLST